MGDGGSPGIGSMTARKWGQTRASSTSSPSKMGGCRQDGAGQDSCQARMGSGLGSLFLYSGSRSTTVRRGTGCEYQQKCGCMV